MEQSSAWERTVGAGHAQPRGGPRAIRSRGELPTVGRHLGFSESYVARRFGRDGVPCRASGRPLPAPAPKVDAAEIVRRRQGGESYIAIATALGISRDMARDRYLLAAGLPRRTSKRPRTLRAASTRIMSRARVDTSLPRAGTTTQSTAPKAPTRLSIKGRAVHWRNSHAKDLRTTTIRISTGGRLTPTTGIALSVGRSTSAKLPELRHGRRYTIAAFSTDKTGNTSAARTRTFNA